MDSGLEHQKKAGLKSRRGQGGPRFKLAEAGREQVRQVLRERNFWSLPQIMELLQRRSGQITAPTTSGACSRLGGGGGRVGAVGCQPRAGGLRVCRREQPGGQQQHGPAVGLFRRPRPVSSGKGLRHNTFGFYAIQGRSVAVETASSRAESFRGCLEAIKRANPQDSCTVVVWDNLPAHCQRGIGEPARSMRIVLVNLPPYSPGLNPIERVWKQIKRPISCQGFVESNEKLGQIIPARFEKLTQSTDLAQKWIEEFFVPVFGKSPTTL